MPRSASDSNRMATFHHNTVNCANTSHGALTSRNLLILLAFAKHIANMVFASDIANMVFASDVWLPAWSTLRRWLRDGPEGQQLKHDVMSSFQDGSLDVTNPDFMALYRPKVASAYKIL